MIGIGLLRCGLSSLRMGEIETRPRYSKHPPTDDTYEGNKGGY